MAEKLTESNLLLYRTRGALTDFLCKAAGKLTTSEMRAGGHRRPWTAETPRELGVASLFCYCFLFIFLLM